jgi:hypothetical protein
MTYTVKTFDAIGRHLNRGYASFKSRDMATSYLWGAIRDCRNNRACQIKTVALYAGDNLITRANV